MFKAGAIVLLALLAGGAAGAGEEAGRAGDPCGFYRGQAFGRGLADFATEMLWACETIEARRAAEVELSAGLVAAEAALARYRAALVAAGGAAFAPPGRRPATRRLGPDEALKRALAQSSGTLAALDAIRSGF